MGGGGGRAEEDPYEEEIHGGTQSRADRLELVSVLLYIAQRVN